jgi:predicted dehydrogenase
MSTQNAKTTRRSFLRHSAAAIIGAPYFIPAKVLGADGGVSPSNRIYMGGIGIGGRGGGDLHALMAESEVQFIANCDVRRERREKVKGEIDGKNGNKDCKSYIDFRELLARTDIDAVLIATSDRWHAVLATMAMKAGKDVYSEKPASFSIAQSQALRAAARKYARIYQGGMQRRSEEKFIFCAMLAQNGYLGKIHTLTGHLWANGFASHRWYPPEPEPPKEELDWDLWLGPCAWRPYNSKYIGERMGHADFWAGPLAEWGSHTFDSCQFFNGSADTAPAEYTYPGNDRGEGMVARYANGVKLVMTARGFPGSCGARVEGSEGSAEASDGPGPTIKPLSLLGERRRLVRMYQAETGHALNHYRDFVDSMKTRRPATASADVTHYAHVIVHCGNISLKLGRNVKWDPVKEEFPGDDQANRMRACPMRAPFQI